MAFLVGSNETSSSAKALADRTSKSSSTPSTTTTKSSSSNDSASTQASGYSSSELEKTAEFKALSKDDQEAVLAVFGTIAGNDKAQSDRLVEAFEASSKINDPYFAQQMRLAVDAIERGYVAIDDEAEFAEAQLLKRQQDLEQDYQSKREFLTLEQASTMREIARAYTQNLDNLQNSMAASGFTQSSRRAKKRGVLEEATGDLRESSNRKFEYQSEQDANALARGERDTQDEIERLKQLADDKKLDFLRTGEAKVGTDNLPDLQGDPAPLGDIYGEIPQEKLQNTISAAQGFVF